MIPWRFNLSKVRLYRNSCWFSFCFLQCGALWSLLQFLFNYDYTLVESGVEVSAESNQQEINNNLARSSIIALARMAGVLEGDNATPDNPAVQKSLNALLTPFVARKFKNETADEVIGLLVYGLCLEICLFVEINTHNHPYFYFISFLSLCLCKSLFSRNQRLIIYWYEKLFTVLKITFK